jgi:glycosyltransferase involved in cell wall biosynthesis
LKRLVVLGTRGIPASHGGFETFAQQLACFLVDRGWAVTVYCQKVGGKNIEYSSWRGVDLVHVPIGSDSAIGTVLFDWKSVLHSVHSKGIFLTLGYNTAIFNCVLRAFGKTVIFNMDGIEWKRQKWGTIAKVWLWFNERIACMIGNQLVADNPGIKDHLAKHTSRKKIAMIPYGAYAVKGVDISPIKQFNLSEKRYALLIARPEPENSILEIVSCFSSQPRGLVLVVLGNYTPKNNAYHASVIQAASSEIMFVGAVYDQKLVDALRCYSRFYIHGHQVGGTNPALVEALGAGVPIIAYDNIFNRWVARDSAKFFRNTDTLSELIGELCISDTACEELGNNARQVFSSSFQWEHVLRKYERLLEVFL